MPTFTIPAAAITADTELASAAQTVNQPIRSGEVRMTDPGGQWPAATDATRHVQCWGIQIDRGAQGWRWWAFAGNTHNSPELNDGAADPMPDNPAQWLPFGARNKDGSLPFVRLSSSQVIEATGQRLRLAILTDANVTLGATITTT